VKLGQNPRSRENHAAGANCRLFFKTRANESRFAVAHISQKTLFDAGLMEANVESRLRAR
jgi:hypothetical protein